MVNYWRMRRKNIIYLQKWPMRFMLRTNRTIIYSDMVFVGEWMWPMAESVTEITLSIFRLELFFDLRLLWAESIRWGSFETKETHSDDNRSIDRLPQDRYWYAQIQWRRPRRPPTLINQQPKSNRRKKIHFYVPFDRTTKCQRIEKKLNGKG